MTKGGVVLPGEIGQWLKELQTSRSGSVDKHFLSGFLK
jgi:hypothetical protein